MPQEIETDFIQEVKELLNSARERTKTAINIAMVYTYYEIGRRILKQEQKGLNRAEYGKKILKQLSSALTKEFGKGYSISNLKAIRQFFVVYSQDRIGQTAFSQSQNLPTTLEGRRFYLGWGHYVRLMRISNLEERHFYEIETYKNNWSVRELNRQFDSALYERLALSKNKEKVIELSNKGQIIDKPMDAIKDPYVLEFLNLKEDNTYSEKDLETKIINKLQLFLLELGKTVDFVFERRNHLEYFFEGWTRAVNHRGHPFVVPN
jgi:predicted nuclease of restriction endonuclease-like (RecB) superfamily